MKISDIMTRDEFVGIGMRIVKLFQPIQPSDEEFLAVRMADNAPGDQFLTDARRTEEVTETANQIFELWFTRPEGNA